MANVRPSAFEHAPTASLVMLRSSGVQLLRQGEIVRRLWARSLSRAGEARCLAGEELYDLVAPIFPQPVGVIPGGGYMLPNGDRLLRWCPSDRVAYVDPKGARHIGLICITVATGEAEVWWKPNEPMAALEYADVHVADDSQTWVLLAGRRMQIGRANKPISFYEDTEPLERFMFDLARQRIIVSMSRARRGLVALPLDREAPFATARCVDTAEAMAVVSPLVASGNEFLGVVRFVPEHGRRAAYEVWRFNETLVPFQRFDGFPRRRSAEDEQLLLRLTDGSLAWVIETERVLLWPAPGVERIETDHIRLVDQWLRTHVPTNTALAAWMAGDALDLDLVANLDSGDRQIMARFILESLSDGIDDDEYLSMFTELLEHDQAAFVPHADWVAAWSDRRLARFAKSTDLYWHVTKGATFAAVDQLVRRIRVKRPADGSAGDLPLSPECKRLLMLLAGVETDYALTQIGPIIDRDMTAERFCRQACLDVWDEGYPAVLRFTHDRQSVVVRPLGLDETYVPNPKLDTLHFRRPSIDELDKPAFRPTDRLPQISLLSMDLSLVPGVTLTSRRPMHEVFYFGSQYYGDPTDTWEKFEALAKRRFEVRLQPAGMPIEAPYKEVGIIGGRPQWVTEPAVPHCLHCGMTMFYIGFVHAQSLLEELNAEHIFSFHCEYCGIIENVPQ